MTVKCSEDRVQRLESLVFRNLSIVWNSMYYKVRFGNWTCSCPQLRGWRHLLCWVPYKESGSITRPLDHWPEWLRSVLSMGLDGVSIHSPEDGKRPIFWTQFFTWPPLWSSGPTSWRQIQRSRVRFQRLPDFLSSSESGTRYIQN
jgi:hypothetical protein